MSPEKIISYWAKAFFLMQKQKPKQDQQKAIKRLALVLKKRKKGYLLERILERFKKIFQREKKVELIFARPQSREFLEKMKKKLLNLFGRDKEIETIISEDIIGGFRIKTGNLLVKASLKDFLTDLEHRLEYEN